MTVCATNPTAGAVLQTLLTVCHRKRPILGKKLNKGIMGYLISLSSAPGVRSEWMDGVIVEWGSWVGGWIKGQKTLGWMERINGWMNVKDE